MIKIDKEMFIKPTDLDPHIMKFHDKIHNGNEPIIRSDYIDFYREKGSLGGIVSYISLANEKSIRKYVKDNVTLQMIFEYYSTKD